MFIDRAKIRVVSGHGGSGCVSFRREKYLPKGGPDGGDGGDGGSVILVGDTHMRSLLDFKGVKQFRAGRGEHGKGKNQHGKSGRDKIVRVPVGTVIYDAITGELVADIVKADQRAVVAPGGKGGKGNARYASPTNQAPREWEPGGPAVERDLLLELKLIADVGIVGLPNAGKSTLLARISDARPKIADYPFTTLQPNLGVVRVGRYDSFVAADIPGLIEGAHMGKGLGYEFLRHIERTRVLLWLIDINAEDPVQDLETLRREMQQYGHALLDKPRVLAISKCDSVSRERIEKFELPDAGAAPLFFISAVTGEGIPALLEALHERLNNVK